MERVASAYRNTIRLREKNPFLYNRFGKCIFNIVLSAFKVLSSYYYYKYIKGIYINY
ncbi:hypothetical protein PZA11_004904 [Diplocarpon coronariae]